MKVYFDNAASTSLVPSVITTMTDLMKTLQGNPSSIHNDGRRARTEIERARKSIAAHLNASIGEIFFTSCGTESNNMAIKCAVRDLGVTRIIATPVEHHCVLHSCEAMAREGIKLDFVNVNNQGKVDEEHLKNLLASSSDTTLVTIIHGNNEIATINDLYKLGAICREYGAYFHADTVQTIGHHIFDLTEMPVDFISGSAHKFHGPKGVGFIYINGDVQLRPFIDGGSQERGMRAGTENVYGIVGMAKALDLAYEHYDERKKHISSLKNYLKSQLLTHFEDIQFNGHLEEALYTVLNVSFPPSSKNDLLIMNLDIAGISASGGSACTSGAEHDSHVLAALGIDTSRKAVRFSFDHNNTQAEVDYLIEVLLKTMK